MTRRAASPEAVATRGAVASCLSDLDAGRRVLVACSGGPDSIALAASAAANVTGST